MAAPLRHRWPQNDVLRTTGGTVLSVVMFAQHLVTVAKDFHGAYRPLLLISAHALPARAIQYGSAGLSSDTHTGASST